MHGRMNTPSLSVAALPAGTTAGAFMPQSERWWRSARAQAPAAAAFVLLLGLLWLPGVVGEGRRGMALVVIALMGPAIIMGLIVALVALLDVHFPRGRARPWLLTAAALAASVAGSAIEIALLLGLGIWSTPRFPLVVVWWANFGGYLIYFPVVTHLYEHFAQARKRVAALADTRRKRALAARSTAEARLQAMQARVDPQFLFDVLDAVESLHEASPEAGERLLDDVIAYLRAAIPDVAAASSTLRREAELARAWLDIQRVLWGDRLTYEVAVPDALASAPFPPMTLVPALEDALAPAAGLSDPMTVRLEARAEGEGVEVRVRAEHPGLAEVPESARIGKLRERLAEMFGTAASVHCAVVPDGRETVLAIGIGRA